MGYMTSTTWDHSSGFLLPLPGSNLSLKLDILLQHYMVSISADTY